MQAASRTRGCLSMLLSVVALTALGSGTASAEPYELEYEVVNVYSTLLDRSGADPLLDWEVNGVDGIAWDGTGIWISSCDTMTMLKLDPDTGEQMDIWWFSEMADMTDHLAWDGAYLWGNVHSMPGDPPPFDGRLVQVDVEKHEIVRTIEVPFRDANSMTPMGMGWDGKYLWTQDPRFNDIYRIDPETEEGVSTPFFKAPYYQGSRLNVCGISWDQYSCLWVSDLGRGAFFQITPDTGEIISYLVPPDNPDPDRYGQYRPPWVRKLFTGMTTDGDRIWIVDEIEGNPLLYELEVDFPNTGPCAHPVEDGEECVADGQPFCFDNSACFEGSCTPRCDVAGQECADDEVCGAESGDPVCVAALPHGEACAPDAFPRCRDDALCFGTDDETVCEPLCEVDTDCGKGLVCGAPTGEDVCVAKGSSGGCSLTRQADRGGYPLWLGVMGALALLARRRRSPISA